MRGRPQMISLLLALLLSAPAAAQTFDVGIGLSSNTCYALGIDSQTPTNVVASTTPGYAYVDILNLDTSTNVWCSDSVAVSSITTAALAGWKITTTAPGNSKRFPLFPGKLWYCLNDGVYSKTRSIVCKGR